MFTRVFCLCALLLLWGCTTGHGPRVFHQSASAQGFHRQVVSAEGFDLALYIPKPQPPGERLHVYLEGDGIPWNRRIFVNPEPTPGNPLMLRLMGKDKAPRLYLGRPCYHGTLSGEDNPCSDSYWWTFGRHNQKIIQAMATTLKRFVERHGYQQVSLFGHSGGGAMAMLIAPKVSAVDTVVTIGGNLDTDAWTSHHSYTSLHGSLNPAKQPPLSANIRQLHLLGGRDSVIPPEVVMPWIRQREATRVYRLYPDYNHHCCWGDIWPLWLRKLEHPNHFPQPEQQGATLMQF